MRRLVLLLAVAVAILAGGTPAGQVRAATVSMGAVPSQQYVLLTGRLRFAGSLNAPTATCGAGGTSPCQNMIATVGIVTANFSCRNPIMAFTNAFGISAATNPETTPGNPVTIDWAEWWSSSAWLAHAPFHGATADTLADGAAVLTDPAPIVLPPNSVSFARVSISIASPSYSFPGYADTSGMTGEAASWKDTLASQGATQTTGTVSGHQSAAFAPIAFGCQGYDGSGDPLLLADSITDGKGDVMDHARGAWGFVARGLDDAASGRMAYVNWAVPSQNAGTTSEGSMAPQHYALRRTVLTMVAGLNANNAWPVSMIYMGHGTNNASNVATANPTIWSLAHTTFNLPVVQPTMTPHTVDTVANDTSCKGGDYCATDTAHQAAQQAGYNPGGAIETFNAALLAGTYLCPTNYPACVDGVADITPYLWNGHGWAFPAFTTTMSRNATAGDQTVFLTACPSLGDAMVLGPGTAGAEAGTTDGGGLIATGAVLTIDCAVTLSASIARNHTAGDPVAEALSNSYLHPNQMGAIAASAGIKAAKLAGVIH